MDAVPTQRLLCLSNGHGEDAIALRILRALQHRAPAVEVAALPIVGKGHAYAQHSIPIVGTTKAMPSGGFIYMDGKQFMRDMQGGLLQLTLAQIRTVRQWARSGGCILAVGDIVPLLFGWMSGAPYAFVGTAKSEYYLRDEQGLLPRASWFEQLESWSGSVYLPWERWLMRQSRCRAVFPRDTLTTKILHRWTIPAMDVGNPMMDDLDADPLTIPDSIAERVNQSDRTLLLLPGSRTPEAYENWALMVQGVQSVVEQAGDRPFLFLAAIAPSIDDTPLITPLEQAGWRVEGWRDVTDGKAPSPLPSIMLTHGHQSLLLVRSGFNACIHLAEGAIAMAGTATEQFVGLGKPAFILPGRGPQFTPAFAEAQTRLLGESVIYVNHPGGMGASIDDVFNDAPRLQRIRENGQRRMGTAGASDRIAQALLQTLLVRPSKM